MGREKFRLVARKNAERKKYAVATSLVVSINRAKLPAPNLSLLETQLSTFDVLPSSWTVTISMDEEAGRKIFLCCLETGRETPIIKYSFTIRENFTWFLRVFANCVVPKFCCVLSNAPDVLDSIDKVMQIISIVEHCKICEGNSDDRFMEVAKRREGVFKNRSGKTKIYHYIASSKN